MGQIRASHFTGDILNSVIKSKEMNKDSSFTIIIDPTLRFCQLNARLYITGLLLSYVL